MSIWIQEVVKFMLIITYPACETCMEPSQLSQQPPVLPIKDGKARSVLTS